jgi:aminoglycoside phosphotransferase (APT) family kinase protein
MSSAGELEERKRFVTGVLQAAGELAQGDHVDSCDQLEGGWSRFSHIAVVRGLDAGERRYVVRVKAPYGLFDTDIIAEYNVFVGLQELALPTPRVFGLHETADNPFGGQLFAMEFLPGDAVNVWRARDHALLKQDWAGRRGIASDVVAAAARIHSISPGQAPPGVPHISYAQQVERWYATYAEAGFNRDPVLEEAFWWLRNNAPGGGAQGLVHGDFRIGNMLVDSGRVTAILDWELAYVGDVRFDLGYMATDYMAGRHLRPKTDLLGAVAEREWFFAEYERLTGAPLDPDAVRAFSVLGLVSLMAMTYKGLRRYADGRNPDFRRAWARFGLPGMRHELSELMEW